MANDTSILTIDGVDYTLKDDGAKRLQSPVSSPAASGTASAFIDTISQDANGVITVTKKNITSDIPGTAAYADQLSNKRAIDGVNFDGSASIAHFTTTDATSGEVALTVNDFDVTNLPTGSRIFVKFTAAYNQLEGGLTIKIRSSSSSSTYTAVKPVYYNNLPLLSVKANKVLEIVYDGNAWLYVGDIDTNTTYTFDGTYNASTNPAATVKTVTDAIEALDVTAITGAANKTITSISETDGKISATYSSIGSLNTSAITAGTLGVARGGTGAASFTTGRVIVSNSSNTTGALTVSDITTTELGYLDGVTSNIQDQINAISGGGTDHIRFLSISLTDATVGGSVTFSCGTNYANVIGGYVVSVNDMVIDQKGQMVKVSTAASATNLSGTMLGYFKAKPKTSYDSSTRKLTILPFSVAGFAS